MKTCSKIENKFVARFRIIKWIISNKENSAIVYASGKNGRDEIKDAFYNKLQELTKNVKETTTI